MEELRRLRKAKGLSQAQLAVMAGLDPSTVSQIETGARHANMRTLARLAAALGSEVADLFPLEQAPLPDFNHEAGFDAGVVMLQHYESMRDRISNFNELEQWERLRVLDEALDLFQELRRIYSLPFNRQNREVALLHDVLYQSVLRMIEAFEREHERGGSGANIVDIKEYKARLRQSA